MVVLDSVFEFLGIGDTFAEGAEQLARLSKTAIKLYALYLAGGTAIVGTVWGAAHGIRSYAEEKGRQLAMEE